MHCVEHDVVTPRPRMVVASYIVGLLAVAMVAFQWNFLRKGSNYFLTNVFTKIKIICRNKMQRRKTMRFFLLTIILFTFPWHQIQIYITSSCNITQNFPSCFEDFRGQFKDSGRFSKLILIIFSVIVNASVDLTY